MPRRPSCSRQETSPLLEPVSPIPIPDDDNGHVPESHDINHTSGGEVEAGLAFRIAAAMYSFVTLGLLASTTGVILPYLTTAYSLTDLHASLIFLFYSLGYILAAQLNSPIHASLGQRAIALAAPTLHILATFAIAAHPPSFAVVLLGFAATGMGTALVDASWCAWAAGMHAHANRVSGLLHGSFSAGAQPRSRVGIISASSA